MNRKDASLFSSRMPMVVGFGAVALFVFGLGGWAMGAKLDGAVIAAGRIVVDQNRQAVQHIDGGIVQEVFIEEGDNVDAGQLLIQLDPTDLKSQLTITENQLYELMARRGRLEAERDEAETISFDSELLEIAEADPEVAALIDGQTRLFEARRENLAKTLTQLENQRAQLKNQIEGIDAQMDAGERQAKLIGEETAVQKSLLERGLAQSSRVLSLQREEARLAGLQGELIARRGQAMERNAEIGIQTLQLQTQRREDSITQLRDLQISEVEAHERREALLTRLDRMDIRAPASGIVYDLQVYGPRSVVRPADPLLFLVPQDRPLVIEARVDPVDVNKVHAQQEVVLRFQAFDMRSTPDLIGSITRVSPDAFTDNTTGMSYYLAEVNLPKEELSKLAEDQVLIPGMPADAFIRTGEHTPMNYLTAPLTRYMSKAMRDGT